MTPLQEKAAIIQAALPEHPEPGEVFRLEEGTGHMLGGASVISVYQGPRLLGSATRIVPITNVSGKYFLERASSKVKLKRRDVIRVVMQQFTFEEIIFIEYFGWCGHKTSEQAHVAFDKHLKVLDVVSVGPQTSGFSLYEKVCLEIIKGVKE